MKQSPEKSKVVEASNPIDSDRTTWLFGNADEIGNESGPCVDPNASKPFGDEV